MMFLFNNSGMEVYFLVHEAKDVSCMFMTIARRWKLKFVCGYLISMGQRDGSVANENGARSCVSFLQFFVNCFFFLVMERETCFGARAWVRLGILPFWGYFIENYTSIVRQQCQILF